MLISKWWEKWIYSNLCILMFHIGNVKNMSKVIYVLNHLFISGSCHLCWFCMAWFLLLGHRSCWKLPLCLAEPVPDGSEDGHALAKAGPMREAVNTSILIYLRRNQNKVNNKGCCEVLVFQPENRGMTLWETRGERGPLPLMEQSLEDCALWESGPHHSSFGRIFCQWEGLRLQLFTGISCLPFTGLDIFPRIWPDTEAKWN